MGTGGYNNVDKYTSFLIFFGVVHSRSFKSVMIFLLIMSVMPVILVLVIDGRGGGWSGRLRWGVCSHVWSVLDGGGRSGGRGRVAVGGRVPFGE